MAAERLYSEGTEIRGVPFGTASAVVKSGLDENQKRALVIADNRIAQSSSWDEDALNRELEFLQASDYDLDVLGFDADELSALLDMSDALGLTDSNDVPDLPDANNAVTQSGDVWVMGKHRLICGDSTLSSVINKVLDDCLADMVWTDPPYNVNYESANGNKIQNDNMGDNEFYNFLLDVFSAAYKNTAEGGPIYIAHADGEGRNFKQALVDSGFLFKQCLVWVKNQFAMGRQDYHWQHEQILYGWKPGAAHKWFGQRNKSTVIDDDIDPSCMTHDELASIVKQIKMESSTSVIREPKPKKNIEHPTMKPVNLVARMIKNSCAPGGTVLDIFGGSGSTLIAAEESKRRARLVEIDPVFCDVIVNRWQNYTGKQAALESDGRPYHDVKMDRLNE